MFCTQNRTIFCSKVKVDPYKFNFHVHTQNEKKGTDATFFALFLVRNFCLNAAILSREEPKN